MTDNYTRAELEQRPAKTKIDNYFYVKSWESAFTKDGKPFIKGVLCNQGEISFKAWDSSEAYKQFQETHLLGRVVSVRAVIDTFTGTRSLVVQDIREEIHGPSYLDLLETIYDEQKCWDSLISCLQRHCSESAIQVFYMIVNDAEISTAFRTEFAAVVHHDSCKTGLLAHTTKVVQHTESLLLYEDILRAIDLDLLFVGAALHDVGKCIEYYQGTISKKGTYASHLTYGPVLIAHYKNEIVRLKGEEFYYGLLSVLSQHHGPYSDSPRTLEAYLIYLMDSLDSGLTDIETHIREDKKSGVRTPISVRDIGKIRY